MNLSLPLTVSATELSYTNSLTYLYTGSGSQAIFDTYLVYLFTIESKSRNLKILRYLYLIRVRVYIKKLKQNAYFCIASLRTGVSREATRVVCTKSLALHRNTTNSSYSNTRTARRHRRTTARHSINNCSNVIWYSLHVTVRDPFHQRARGEPSTPSRRRSRP